MIYENKVGHKSELFIILALCLVLCCLMTGQAFAADSHYFANGVEYESTTTHTGLCTSDTCGEAPHQVSAQHVFMTIGDEMQACIETGCDARKIKLHYDAYAMIDGVETLIQSDIVTPYWSNVGSAAVDRWPVSVLPYGPDVIEYEGGRYAIINTQFQIDVHMDNPRIKIQYEKIPDVRMSVWVPESVELIIHRDGAQDFYQDYGIYNTNEDKAVAVKSIKLTAVNGWTFSPNPQKGDKTLNVKVNGFDTRITGLTEAEVTLSDSSFVVGTNSVVPLNIAVNAAAQLQDLTGVNALRVEFVVDWAD